VEESGNMYNITVEYELTGGDALKDVTVTIPYQTDEPNVSSFDAVYEVSGDSIEWNVGTVDEANSSGSFEFEAQAGMDSEFFPMRVRFTKSTPFVDVDVRFHPKSESVANQKLTICRYHLSPSFPWARKSTSRKKSSPSRRHTRSHKLCDTYSGACLRAKVIRLTRGDRNPTCTTITKVIQYMYLLPLVEICLT
jgi:hypothetical protein